MFGIVNRKGNDVLHPTISVYNSLSDKEKCVRFITSEMEEKPLSKAQAPMGRLSLIFFHKPPFKHRGLFYEGRIYGDIRFGPNVQGSLEDVLKEMIEILDGEYSLAATNGSKIIVARDPIGRKPIFYAEDDEILAFASEKKMLWSIGLKNVKPLRAGKLASLSEGGINISEAIPFKKTNISRTDLDEVVHEYHKLLHMAVVKRLIDFQKVGVLLSGGVDSSLLAKMVSEFAKRMGIKVTVYTAGTKSAVDVEYAERFAQEMGLNHKVRKLGIPEVESYIPQVIKTVEERDFVQIEAGIGVYVAEEMAAQDGMEVIFSGQGPDEIWGGYSWYPQVIAKEGYEGFLQKSWGDLERADIETFDRENKIAKAHGIEVVFPYVDTQLVEFAMNVSPKLKIYSPEDTLGKRPHREMAKQAGIPHEYAVRGKDATQHGTGIHDVLDEIAKRRGFNPKIVRQLDYKSDKVSKERLSSSARYGFQYAERSLWEIDEHIQFFLDVIAYKLGLLNESERMKIREFLKRT